MRFVETKLAAERPDFVVHTAVYAAVGNGEAKPRVIRISTDFVFDAGKGALQTCSTGT